MKPLLVPVSLVLLSGAVGVGLSAGHQALTAAARLPAQPVIAAAPAMPSSEHYDALARSLPASVPVPGSPPPTASAATAGSTGAEVARLALAPMSSPRPMARDARGGIAGDDAPEAAASEPPATAEPARLTLAGPLTEVMGTMGERIDAAPDYLHGVFR